MLFDKPLVHGKFIKRYKRFLADIELDNGQLITAHCANSGSLKSCLEPGAEVYLSENNDPDRKTRFSWEMIKINGHWVGINTSVSNRLAEEALRMDLIPGLEGYQTIRREVTFGNSRFDLFAAKPDEECFIEVKNVTLNEGGVAMFPDAVTTRGQKHLETLMEVKKCGLRAVMLYIVQRMDVDSFAPARHIDPAYAQKLEEALKKGVEVIPMQVRVSPEGIFPERVLKINNQGLGAGHKKFGA